MEYYVSKNTLDSFEEIVYKINLKLLKEVHKKYLKDLDFIELKNILDGIKKKTYFIEIDNESQSDNESLSGNESQSDNE